MGFLDAIRGIFSGKGRGYDVDELARRLGMRALDLEKISPDYREFQIPKRRGGARTISAPAESLKKIQRRILRRLLGRLKAHPAVHGFERGKSIVSNATTHARQALIINVDMRDFFESTIETRVLRYFRRIGWNKPAAQILTKICTYRGGLPQGAPTSPRLSNVVNCQLDARLAGFAKACDAAYTRYADDITFSFSDEQSAASRSTVGFIREVLSEYGYQLHDKKTRVLRRHHQQRVTGLVVNDGVRLPRKTRRWLRAVEHRLATDGASTLSEAQLAGWRSFQKMVEGR
jgi:RNA-directed DNA polymerase